MFKIIGVYFLLECGLGQHMFRQHGDFTPGHHYEGMYQPKVGESLVDRILHIRERLRSLRDLSHAEAGVYHISSNHSTLDSGHPVRSAYRAVELVFFLIAGVVIAGFIYINKSRKIVSAAPCEGPVELKEKVNYYGSTDASVA